MVVLKSISDDMAIVTAFCVDADLKIKFYERYKYFEEGKGTC